MTELAIIEGETCATFDINRTEPGARDICVNVRFRLEHFELANACDGATKGPAGVCLFASIDDAKALRAYLDVAIPILEAQRAADEVRK